jgi:hypothetical protein
LLGTGIGEIGSSAYDGAHKDAANAKNIAQHANLFDKLSISFANFAVD